MLHSRLERVNSLLRNTISEILLNDLKDPRLGFVTIIRVGVSKDLRTATVFVSLLSDDPQQAALTLQTLQNAKGYIRSLLASRVVLKSLPDLKFQLDRGAAHAQRIETILHDLEEKPSPDGTPEE